MLLSDIPPIKNAFKTARVNKFLPVLVFNDDKMRRKRKNLRSFPGFDFEINDDRFGEKLQKIQDDFLQIYLISIASLLNNIYIYDINGYIIYIYRYNRDKTGNSVQNFGCPHGYRGI